jgi:replicative DNA helicase
MAKKGYTKIPPYNQEAEMSVLGAMLIDKQAIATALEILKTDDFYMEDNKRIFEAVLSLFESALPIDIVTLAEKLSKEGDLENIGGLEKITYLIAAVPSSSNVRYYANIVKEKALLRKLINSASEMMEMGFDDSESANNILDRAEKRIFDLLQDRNTKGYMHISEIIEDALRRLEELSKREGNITGVPTGLVDLDNKLAGLQRSDLILIAARPSMGKSSLALNIAQFASIKKGVPTVVFSLEMSREQVVNRIICSEAMVDSGKVKTGKLSSDEWVRVAEVIGPISNSPLYIDDTAGTTVNEIRAKCRKLKLEHNIGLVVIDYLQLIQGSGRSENRQQEVSEMSRSLKILAKDLDIPVVCLSQLSRAPETRSSHKPILSDLRESGAIEQDADIVIFIYRQMEGGKDDEVSNVAEIIIAKHRNGATGTIEALWLGEYTKFVNMESDFDD